MPRLIAFFVALAVALLADGPVTEALRSDPTWLTDAASRITWIGNTGWMFIGLVSLMAALALCRPDPTSAARAEALLRVVIGCFLLILLTGLAVQGLKHLFGRPRPLASGDFTALTFAPLGFTRGWNAFPSGHATTMGALAVLATKLWPRAWLLAWGLAVVVGISRVLVGMHYPSDVVAGLALGSVLAAWMIERWQAEGVLDLRGLALPTPGLGPLSELRTVPRGFGALLSALFSRVRRNSG